VLTVVVTTIDAHDTYIARRPAADRRRVSVIVMFISRTYVMYVPWYINSDYHYYSRRRASALAFSTPVDFLYGIHYYN